MPLHRGKKNVGRNVRAELRAGKPLKQAVAIAYRAAEGDAIKALEKGSHMHQDSWFNVMTGIGTPLDKATHTRFCADPWLTPQECAQMFAFDDIVRIVVETWPEEMLREGWIVKGPPPDVVDALDAEVDRLRVLDKVQEAETWGPLFGGNLLWLGVDDGKDPCEPLGIPRRVRFLENIDRRYAQPAPGQPVLFPSVWEVQPISEAYGRGAQRPIHATRTIRFGGAKTEDEARLRLNGWDYSILQAILGPLKHFNDTFAASGIMMADASTAVMRIKGLIAALAGKRSDEMRQRASLLNTTRSVARIVMLDADFNETFEKVATQFAGVSDVLVMAAKRLAAATRIPVPILMGEAPAGLNATGDSTIRMFYDRVNAKRKRLNRPLLRILRLIARTLGYTGPLSIEWPSLWQESPAENAARRKVVAETDQIYATLGVLTPDEIKENRFRTSGWSPETEVDLTDIREYTPPPGLPGT